MNEKNIKKSFYVTPELADAWEEFHKPSKDYSPSAAAGMLFYLMADFPGIRESFRKLATEKDIKKSAQKARQLLIEAVVQSEITRYGKELGIPQSEFLAALMRAKEQIDDKKKDTPNP